MAAATLDLTIEQGATFRLSFVYGTRGADDVDGNPTIGTPHNLTGCSAKMQIRQRAGEPVLIDLETVTDPSVAGIMLGGVDGTVAIHIPDELTDTLVVRRARYDLKIIYPSGDERRILKGKVTIDPATTTDT